MPSDLLRANGFCPMASFSMQDEISRRRTFAIISHPDAGKTTLTEKLLLYGGAVQLAGSVKARKDQRAATSDWMELERKRGISISSTVLQFDYAGYRINLLDTPGHKDFSEDTYRVLTAVDAVVMVIDAGKGIEAQTRKLFEVCRRRGVPIFTFMNKVDRPTRDPLALVDELESVLGIGAFPVNWPLGVRAGLPRRIRPADAGRASLRAHQRRGLPRAGHHHRPRRPARAGEAGRIRLPPRGRGAGDARDRGQGILRARGALRPSHAGLLRQRHEQLRRPVAARFLPRALRSARAAPVRGAGHPARRPGFLRVRFQDPGKHGPEAPGPDRVRAGLLGEIRARHGRHPRRRAARRCGSRARTSSSARNARPSTRPSRATSSVSWGTPASASAIRSHRTRRSASTRFPGSRRSASPTCTTRIPASSSNSARGWTNCSRKG